MSQADGDRSAVLQVVESTMRSSGGLLDPDLIERVSDRSGVERAVIVQRWRSGESLIADMVSERAIGAPEYPDAQVFAGAGREDVLSALVQSIGRSVEDEALARSALSQTLVSSPVRTVWFDFVRDALEKWAEILADTVEGPADSVDRKGAAQAVSIVAAQCYSRMLLRDSRMPLGDAALHVPDVQIVRVAMMVLDRGGLG